MNVLVVYNGKKYTGTLVTINRNTNTVGVDLSIDGKMSEQFTFDLDEVLQLNPKLRGKPLARW
jgi:hypothetical protein